MTQVLKTYVRMLVESMDDDYEASMRAMEARWEANLNDPNVKPFIDAIRNAQDLKELAKAKRALQKADDSGQITVIPGAWMQVYDKRKEELKDVAADERRLADPAKATADARMDRLLRIRTSSGKATPRKF